MEKIQDKRTKRFIIGVGIIVFSTVIGWPMLPICAFLALKLGPTWLVIGGVIYTISWILLGFGILLAGPAGIKFSKELFRKIFRNKRSMKND